MTGNVSGRLASRLAKLERVAFEASGGGHCTMCWGQSCAVLLVVHEVVRSGLNIASIRKTGVIYLAEECIGRITEDLHDLCCVSCGTKARRAAVMYTPEFKFEPVRPLFV